MAKHNVSYQGCARGDDVDADVSRDQLQNPISPLHSLHFHHFPHPLPNHNQNPIHLIAIPLL